jgi:hypothetical protein
MTVWDGRDRFTAPGICIDLSSFIGWLLALRVAALD